MLGSTRSYALTLCAPSLPPLQSASFYALGIDRVQAVCQVQRRVSDKHDKTE